MKTFTNVLKILQIKVSPSQFCNLDIQTKNTNNLNKIIFATFGVLAVVLSVIHVSWDEAVMLGQWLTTEHHIPGDLNPHSGSWFISYMLQSVLQLCNMMLS
jgi:hypothetical protein